MLLNGTRPPEGWNTSPGSLREVREGANVPLSASSAADVIRPTVHVVDGNPELREAVRDLVQGIGLQVHVYGSAREFWSRYSDQQPGCLILDVQLPDSSGLELYEQLCDRDEALPVIFVSGSADVGVAIRAIRAGAVEFVQKPIHGTLLLEHVQRALKQDLQRRREQAAREAIAARFSKLTEKEREVLELVKRGLPNKAIASRLQITSRAVEMRRASLMRKLAVNSFAELLYLTFRRDMELSERMPAFER